MASMLHTSLLRASVADAPVMSKGVRECVYQAMYTAYVYEHDSFNRPLAAIFFFARILATRLLRITLFRSIPHCTVDHRAVMGG